MKTIKKVERSQGLVEYALIIVLIAIVVIVAIQVFNVDVGAIVGSLPQGDETAVPTEEVSGQGDEVAEIEFTATPLPTIPPTVTLPLPTSTLVPTFTSSPTTTSTPIPVVEEEVHPRMWEEMEYLVTVAKATGCPNAYARYERVPDEAVIHAGVNFEDEVYLHLYLCGDSEDDFLLVFYSMEYYFLYRDLTPENIQAMYTAQKYVGHYFLASSEFGLHGKTQEALLCVYTCRFNSVDPLLGEPPAIVRIKPSVREALLFRYAVNIVLDFDFDRICGCDP